MKIIIIGDGKVGHLLAKQLSEQNYDIVIIDHNIDNLKKSINNLDINYVEGNGSDADVLIDAGVAETDLVVACTSADEVNMMCCLLAKNLGAKQTIARVRNPVFFKQIDLIKDDIHLSMAVNPDFAMAEEIARVLIFPAADKVETFVKGGVELVEATIEEDNIFIGMSLMQIYKKHRVKFLICAVQRDDKVYIPDGSFVLEAGDVINIAACHNEIKRLFRIMKMYRNKIKTVMICGGSRTAYYLSRKLLPFGMDVKIIEKDEVRCRELCDLLPKATIIKADATNHELLKEEGIEHVDAVIALTGMDEENIVISMYAKSKNVSKIVTKVNSESLIKIIDSLDFESIVTPKKITVDLIMSYIRAMENSLSSVNVEALYRLVNGQIEALEFNIKENTYYLNVPLKKLKLKANILVAAIARGRQIIIPNGEDVLKKGDSVVVVTKDRQIQEFSDIIQYIQEQDNES